MTTHAYLAPSSAHRWLTCTPSVQATAHLSGESSSVYAEEGTLAHTIAHGVAALRFGLKAPEFPAGEEITDEMKEHAEEYADLLQEQRPDGAVTLLEQRVYPGVPECSGTADAIQFGTTELVVTDYKFGKGVAVEAEENPQLMLYGLGALETFGDLAEPEIVTLVVHQPRLDSISRWSTTPETLRRWRQDVVLPAAEAALSGLGIFRPSLEACRFCPISGDCRIRAEAITTADFSEPAQMDADEIGRALSRAPELRQWLDALEEMALRRAQVERIPGWKMVRSGGQRKVEDHAAAIQTLIDHGFKAEQVARAQLQTFAVLDRLMRGTDQKLSDVLGDLLGKTEGRLSLVVESDKREAVGADFAEDDGSDLI